MILDLLIESVIEDIILEASGKGSSDSVFICTPQTSQSVLDIGRRTVSILADTKVTTSLHEAHYYIQDGNPKLLVVADFNDLAAYNPKISGYKGSVSTSTTGAVSSSDKSYNKSSSSSTSEKSLKDEFKDELRKSKETLKKIQDYTKDANSKHAIDMAAKYAEEESLDKKGADFSHFLKTMRNTLRIAQNKSPEKIDVPSDDELKKIVRSVESTGSAGPTALKNWKMTAGTVLKIPQGSKIYIVKTQGLKDNIIDSLRSSYSNVFILDFNKLQQAGRVSELNALNNMLVSGGATQAQAKQQTPQNNDRPSYRKRQIKQMRNR